MSDNVSSFKLFKEVFILNKLFRSFCLFSAKSGQCKKKWSVVSVSQPQSHIGLGASLKLWRNLYSFKWLNFNRSLDNKLTPTGSWIVKRDFCFKLKNSLNIVIICLILLASLSELSSLYHSWTQKGKKRLFQMFSSCPKPSDFVLVWYCCIVNRVFVGVQITSKVTWGSSVYNFMRLFSKDSKPSFW